MEDWHKLKKFDFTETTYLSFQQLKNHYELYKSLVKRLNKMYLLEEIDAPGYETKVNKLGIIKLLETPILNSLKLHELYFENLGSEFNFCKGDIYRLIEENFKSYKSWENEFTEVGLSVDSWVVLAINENKQLHVFGADNDELGFWGAHPVLVMDVNQHAYDIDFDNKKQYISRFMKNVNWLEVNKRLRSFFGHSKNCFKNIL